MQLIFNFFSDNSQQENFQYLTQKEMTPPTEILRLHDHLFFVSLVKLFSYEWLLYSDETSSKELRWIISPTL